MKALPNWNGDTVYDDGCQNEEVVDGNDYSVDSAATYNDDAKDTHALNRSRDPSSGITSNATWV